MTPTTEQELAALRRPFAIGVACVLLAVLALGLVIARFGSNADRPAGIAERWLVAVGDTTRDGIEDDARDRIAELTPRGAVNDQLISSLIELSPTAAEQGESAFEVVQVGPPIDEDDVLLVPASVTPRDGDPVLLYLELADFGDGWAVVGPLAVVAAADIPACIAADDCPGFPIERPERAPIGWFVGALALGVLVTLGCVAAVRAATPRPN